MKTTIKQLSMATQAERLPRANKQAPTGSILQAYKDKTVQCWPFSKPLWVPGPGKGPIPFMGAQYDAQYRDPKHKELLQSIPPEQCPVKTFHQENDFASQYPMEGSKSMIGDAGIYAHKIYNHLGWPFK